MIENSYSRPGYPMTGRLEITSLQRKEEMEQAFPLIQSIAPDISLENWLEFASEIEDTSAIRFWPCGVVAARTSRGYFHGLFSYMVAPDLPHGRILSVHNFVAFDFADRWHVVPNLLEAMNDLAGVYDCKAIHVSIPDRLMRGPVGRQALLDKFREYGHDVQSVGLCKEIMDA